MKLGVCVIYSSIDHFLWPLLKQQVEDIADDAIVVRRTHLFSGEKEPLPDLGMRTLTLPLEDADDHWDQMRKMRFHGVRELRNDITHIMLLDSDELFEVDRLKGSLSNTPTFFAADWYWRVGWVKAVQSNETSGLLCRREHMLMDTKEGDREKMAVGIQRPRIYPPIFHHYSWCKPIDQMHRKIRNWVHKDDKPWESMLMHEWKQPLPGTCFVHRNRKLVLCHDKFGIGDPT